MTEQDKQATEQTQPTPKKRTAAKRTAKTQDAVPEIVADTASQETAVKPKRRVVRKKATAETSALETPAPAVADHAAGQEEPVVKKRVYRRKKTVEPPEGTDTTAAAVEASEPKAPVKRRVTRKKTDDRAPEAVVPSMEEPAAETAVKKRVYRRKTAVAPAAEAVAETTPAPSAAKQQSPKRRTPRKKAAETEAAPETLPKAENTAVPEAPKRKRTYVRKKAVIAPEAVPEAAPASEESAAIAETEPKAVENVASPVKPKRTRTPRAAKSAAVSVPAQEEIVDETPVAQSLLEGKLFDPKVVSRGKAAQKKQELAQSEKLHKVLADMGLGSRRDMEQLILEGRITVNAEPAHLGQRVMPGDIVRLNGKIVKRMQSAGGKPKIPRVLVYHKPTGEIVSMDDPQGRPTVFDNLPKVNGGRWIVVGRLDFNTEGLLLFTTSGELANRLMHPRYRIEREYLVRAAGLMTDEAREALTTGVELEDGPAAFSLLEDKGGENLNRWYLVRISEGRNREVRRMFAAVGLTVSRLIRVRYGAVRLPADLLRGQKVELKPQWVEAWMSELASQQPPQTSRGPKAKRDGHASKGKSSSRGQYNKGNNKNWQPDPMTSTVQYIASGMLGMADHAYGKALAQASRPEPPKGNFKGPRPGAARRPAFKKSGRR